MTSPTTLRPRADVPAGRTLVRRAVFLAAAVATAVLAWYVTGTTGVTVIASVWLLADGVGRLVPGMRGAAGWAAAITAELVLVIGASAVVAIAAPGPHGSVVWSAMLAVPAVAGVVLEVVSAVRRRDPRADEQAHAGLALAITALILGCFAAIERQGRYFDVAWAMSGDARNHALIVRSIIADGGLTLDSLRSYPAAVNGFAAVVAAAAGRGGAAGQLVLDDAHALATMYVLSAIALGVLLAGALLETLAADRHRQRLSVPVALVALVTATGAVTPLVLGTTLLDGFFSAYGALVPALATIVLALRCVREPRPLPLLLVLASVSTVLTFVSWTVLVAVPWAALLAAIVSVLRGRRGTAADMAASTRWWGVAGLAVAGLALVAVVAVVVAYLPTFRVIFALPGSIIAPSRWLLLSLVLVSCALALGGGDALLRRQLWVPAAAGLIGGAAVLALRVLGQAGHLTWTYYASKTSWLVVCSLLWIPFVPLIRWASGFGRDVEETTRWPSWIGAAIAGPAAVMLVLGTATTAPNPLSLAARGWSQPSAEAVEDVVQAADQPGPFVVWRLTDGGNDRIANFWAALAWASRDGAWVEPPPGASQSFPVWAYFVDESQVSQLCEAASLSPGIVVYTAEPSVASDLQTACPAADLSVVVEPRS
ncbi:hypothetical protein [Cellulomonas citrea]|uniref:hypothetical protein n=1 Tax=Cellulomonas citrea TaxID=1909423 RepID=UPI00135A8DF5|nr:hypothetical protein [Cellulomonas citrea]